MLKHFLRTIAINSLAVFLSSQLISGLIIFTGNLSTLLFTGFVFFIVNLLVKPIINLLLLPIQILTLGFFRWLTNLLLLFIVTKLVPAFTIHSYLSSRLDLGFITIPPTYFSIFGSYLLATFILSLVFHFLYWLFED